RRCLADDGLEATEGVLVQPMAGSEVEVMVSMLEDPSFGPLIVFGLGGIYVEVIADVGVRVTPLTDRAAAAMVREIRGYPLLEGYRGHPPADIEAIQDVLLRVSRLVEEVPEIAELEASPIFVKPPGEGCYIGDSRIRVALPQKGRAGPVHHGVAQGCPEPGGRLTVAPACSGPALHGAPRSLPSLRPGCAAWSTIREGASHDRDH
ncbi:MAG TPA: acetate--CoA ligase family protein, partial [Thermoanaerobaculia bacterium]|nr:acetate--CoA ligase family protein [Thermoanaerobaculia bacterium]